MKKIAILFISLIICIACEKSDLELTEEKAIESYISSNLIEEQPSSSGLYFIMDKLDSDEKDTGLPSIGDIIIFGYTGKMLTENSEIYFQTNENFIRFTFGKDNTIDGLKEGLALVKKGCTARLVLPSAIAYGDVQVGTVPPFTPLLIELEVHDIIRK